MTGTRPAGGRARRALLRERDGTTVDPAARRVVDAEELLDDLKAGRRFRVRRRDTGADCTVEVLAELLESALSARAGGWGVLGLLAPGRAATASDEVVPVVPLRPVAGAGTEVDGGG